MYAFVKVLAYSRMLFIDFTTSLKMGVLLDCQQKAFAFFKGWVQTILYDNMKSVSPRTAR